MKVKILIVTALLISISESIHCQPYEKVISENTSMWYFAQMLTFGEFIDTLYSGKEENGSIELWYNGVYTYGESTYAGNVRSSEEFDKLWYTAPESNEEVLIYDISLETGDTFDFIFSDNLSVVDSVYFHDGRKIIKFNYDYKWGERKQFIEGVGPNTTILWAWEEPMLHWPIVLCYFEDEIQEYSIDNDNFDDCGFSNASSEQALISEMNVYPNPFDEQLLIEINSSTHASSIEITINSIIGSVLYNYSTSSNQELVINCSEYPHGTYFLTVTTDKSFRTFKLLKL